MPRTAARALRTLVPCLIALLLALPAAAQELRTDRPAEEGFARSDAFNGSPPSTPQPNTAGREARRGNTPDWDTGGGETAGDIGTRVETGRDVSEALEGAVERTAPNLESEQAVSAEREARLRDEPFSFEDDTGAARARAALRGTEDFEPLGIRKGAYLLRPSIEVRGGAQFDDGPDDARGFVRLQPELGIESDWSRHRLEGRIGWREERFPDDRARDETRIDGDLRLRLDVTRRTEIYAAVGFARDETSSTDTDVPANAAGDTVVDTTQASLALRHAFGRMTGTLRGSLSRERFDETPLIGGGFADSSERDFDERAAGLRLDYAATDRSGVFIDVEVNERDFSAGQNADGRPLGSEGVSALAGVRFDNRATFSGDLAAGVQIQDPNDPQLDTITAFIVEGSALWSPSALTTFSLEASTTVDDSTTTGESPEAEYAFRAGVAHALRRNVILDGGIGYSVDEDASSLTFDAGFEYRIKREIAIVGDVSHEISDVAGDTENETTVSVGVRVER